jgi:hypothetical protein
MLRKMNVFVLTSFLGLLTPSYSTAQDSSTPEALIKSIYAAHRPWDRYETLNERIRIDFYDELQMSKYFDSEIVALFQMDRVCQKKMEGYCSFDSDPIFFSQDSVTDHGYEVSLNRIKETDSYAEYEAIVHWVGFEKPKGGYVFILNKTRNGWRVSDIRHGEHSRKNSMTSILKEYGFYSTASPVDTEKCVGVALDDRYVISGTHVNLRQGPSISADKLGAVQIGLRVKIEEVSESCENIQGKWGRWVRVSAKNVPTFAGYPGFENYVKEFSGWIFSGFILKLDEFERVGDWKGFEKFSNCIGDACTELRMYPDGSFQAVGTSIQFKDKGTEYEEKVFSQGITFRAGNIMWFKIQSIPFLRTGGYIVVRDEQGKFCFAQNIDYLSGNCSEYSESGVYPAEEKIQDKKEEKKTMEIKKQPKEYSV